MTIEQASNLTASDKPVAVPSVAASLCIKQSDRLNGPFKNISRRTSLVGKIAILLSLQHLFPAILKGAFYS